MVRRRSIPGAYKSGAPLAMVSDVSLVFRNAVELRGPLLIKERAFGLVAAAPVLGGHLWRALKIQG